MLSRIITVLIFCTLSVVSMPVLGSAIKGSKAPEFELPDQSGNTHKLSDFRGQWVVLYFYPRDDTPGCTIEAGEFRDNKAALDELNTVVMGVSVDGIDSHAAFHKDMKLNFNLLSDSNKDVSKAYNVLNDIVVLSYSKRQTFIIDPMGMIAHHFEDVDPKTHTPEVIKTLKEVQKIYQK